MDYAKITKDIGEQIDSAIKPLQDLSIDVISSVAATVGDLLPELKVSVPTPGQVADANFGLAEHVLASQKSYASKLFGALEPITSKFVGSTKPKAKAGASA